MKKWKENNMYTYHYRWVINLMAERCLLFSSDTPFESEMGARDLRNVVIEWNWLCPVGKA